MSVIRHGSCFVLGNGNGDIDNSEEILQPILTAYPKVYFILLKALFKDFKLKVTEDDFQEIESFTGKQERVDFLANSIHEEITRF